MENGKQHGGDGGRSELIRPDFLLQTMPGFVVVCQMGPEGLRVLTCSRGVTTLLGWDASVLCGDGQMAPRIISPADEDVLIHTIREIIRTGKPGEVVCRGQRMDGTVVWLWFQGRYAGEENGAPLVEGMFLDVTGNAAMFQTILDQAQAIITVVDAHTFEHLYANATARGIIASIAARRHLDNPSGDCTGTVCYRYVYGLDKPCACCIVNHTAEDSYVNEELEVKGRFYRQIFKRLAWQGRDAILEFTTDVTEQVRNRRMIENQQKLQERILDTIAAGVMVFKYTEDGIHIVAVNRSIVDMMGMDKNKALGEAKTNITALTHPDDLPIVLDAAKRLGVAGAYVEYEYRHFFRTRNAYIWVLGQGRSVRNPDGCIYAYVNYTDITARKQVEALQLRQRELFDTIPSGILEFFFDGRALKVLSANQTLIDMVGCDADTFYARQQWDLTEIVHPDDFHLLREASQSIPLGKGKTYDFRLRNMRTGLYRWISCDYTITDRSKDGIRVISAFLDIDDKRKAEDASAAKSRFLSRMSHEIRTPINAIMGIAELVEQDIEAQRVDLEMLKHYSEETLSASHYLLTLVNDILDTSRIENNQIEIQRQMVNATHFLSDVRTLVAPLAKEKDIHFLFERRTQAHEVYLGDEVRAKQIIVNLLNNAFKFTPRGGTVSLCCESVGEKDGQVMLRFTVTDNGIGMSRKFQERLFTPFAQENSGNTSPFSGSGLGLSIAKNLAQRMGGDIVCRSEQGKGTTFVVTVAAGLPAAGEAERVQASSEQASTLPVNLAGVRVLLCEDHPLNQKITKALLERKGCTVELASNGAEGVQMFASSVAGYYDMILMDIRMPVMDGLQATRELRRLDRADAKTIPVVAMSANAYAEDVQASLSAGMNDHLAKPVDATKLYDTVARFVVRK